VTNGGKNTFPLDRPDARKKRGEGGILLKKENKGTRFKAAAPHRQARVRAEKRGRKKKEGGLDPSCIIAEKGKRGKEKGEKGKKLRQGIVPYRAGRSPCRQKRWNVDRQKKERFLSLLLPEKAKKKKGG